MARDDHSTHSCWQSTVKTIRGTALRKNENCDVCIVGGGIAGLSVAYQVAKAGLSVVVLEAQHIGGGETGRTSAHLVTALDRRYSDLRTCHGEERTRLIAESHRAAVDTIERIAGEEAIDCDFRRCFGFLIGTTNDGAQIINDEKIAATNAGLPVEASTETPLDSFQTCSSLRFDRQALFHPLKYLKGIAAAVKRLGGILHHDARAKEIVGGKDAHVTTESGRTVHAKHIVVATNSPVNNLTTMHTSLAAYRSYMIGLELDPADSFSDLFWDTEEPFHYVRCHDLGGRKPSPTLLVGGEDHKTGQTEEPRFDNLEAWARQHFPKAKGRRFAWSGQVLESLDGIAYIGRNPHDEDNVYICTGDCGDGMTHSVIAGELLAALIQSQDHPWAKVYAPDRIRPTGTWRFAKENANVAAQYASWLTSGDVAKAEDVQPGSGAILRDGLRKIALYREPTGELHQMSATCPHLGCIVGWNGAEKSWDCPCHGSRFAANGTVLSGPALTGLSPIEEPAVVK
jgi:glycine/D-amino acid oxidase-like deaminating enzyme/nitrite reductase/ring-hydroxylating ferredoxin subunit